MRHRATDCMNQNGGHVDGNLYVIFYLFILLCYVAKKSEKKIIKKIRKRCFIGINYRTRLFFALTNIALSQLSQQRHIFFISFFQYRKA